jgi:hypothetical protein
MIVAGTLNLTIVRGCTFEALVLVMQDSTGTPVNITGFTVSAEVRLDSGSPVIVNLNPSITDAVNGEVTIPEIDDEITPSFTAGVYHWDLLLEQTGTDNQQQMLTGRVYVEDKITAS